MKARFDVLPLCQRLIAMSFASCVVMMIVSLMAQACFPPDGLLNTCCGTCRERMQAAIRQGAPDRRP